MIINIDTAIRHTAANVWLLYGAKSNTSFKRVPIGCENKTRSLYFLVRAFTEYISYMYNKLNVYFSRVKTSIFMLMQLKIINEPAHDKPYKMACAPSEDSDKTGHAPSLV